MKTGIEMKNKKINLNYTKYQHVKLPDHFHEKVVHLENKLNKEINEKDEGDLINLLKVNLILN